MRFPTAPFLKNPFALKRLKSPIGAKRTKIRLYRKIVSEHLVKSVNKPEKFSCFVRRCDESKIVFQRLSVKYDKQAEKNGMATLQALKNRV